MYGNLQAEVGTVSQPCLFSTKRYDYQLGTYYYGYRFYSPSTGRWLTRDPLGEAGGLNLYGFVGNDPVNWVDPQGENPLLIVLGIIGSFTAGYHIGDWIVDVSVTIETIDKIEECPVGKGTLAEEEKAALEYGKLRVQPFKDTVGVHESAIHLPGTFTGGLPPGVRPTR